MHIALIVPEGVQTSDRRLIQNGALTWRDNLPVMFQDSTTPNHEGAVHVGNAVNIRRETVDGQTWIVGDVEWDTDQDAQEAMRLADEGKIAGVSADIGGVTAELEIIEVDDEGFPTDWLETITAGEVIGVTQLPMPAFGDARIMRTEMVATGRIVQELPESSVVAAAFASLGDWSPPRELFEMPEPDEPTFTTVYEHGHYLGFYGHASQDWSQCHIGYTDSCVPPPVSPTNGGEFNTRPVRCADGTDILVGPVTMGTDPRGGHADLGASVSETVAHYDNANTVIAVARMSNGAFGPWLSGVILPDVSDDQLRRFKLMQLSGDWRRAYGEDALDMRACLAVPVGGFGVKARVASGEVTAMIAAGPPPPERRDREDLIYEALRLLSVKIDALAAKDEPPYKGLRQMTTTKIETNEETLERTRPVETAMGHIAALLDTSTG